MAAGWSAPWLPRPDVPVSVDLTDLRRRIEARYKTCGRFARGYVHWKLRLDPILPTVLALAGRERFGRVVDLGCGRGQLGVALLETGCADELTGLDWDEALLAEGTIAAAGKAQFRQADLRTSPVPAADTVMIIDVLQQMPGEVQLDLLRRAAEAARERVILRLFDPQRGWRSTVGWISDSGIWLAGLYRRAHVQPLPLGAHLAVLERAGFACETLPCWGIMPLPNVLVVARRQEFSAP